MTSLAGPLSYRWAAVLAHVVRHASSDIQMFQVRARAELLFPPKLIQARRGHLERSPYKSREEDTLCWQMLGPTLGFKPGRGFQDTQGRVTRSCIFLCAWPGDCGRRHGMCSPQAADELLWCPQLESSCKWCCVLSVQKPCSWREEI